MKGLAQYVEKHASIVDALKEKFPSAKLVAVGGEALIFDLNSSRIVKLAKNNHLQDGFIVIDRYVKDHAEFQSIFPKIFEIGSVSNGYPYTVKEKIKSEEEKVESIAQKILLKHSITKRHGDDALWTLSNHQAIFKDELPELFNLWDLGWKLCMKVGFDEPDFHSGQIGSKDGKYKLFEI